MRKASPLLAHVGRDPLLIDNASESLFQECLNHVISHEHAEMLQNAAATQGDDDFWYAPDDYRSAYRPYSVIDGVLQIPVMGVLLSRFPWQLGRWATGYKYIEMAFRRGLQDPEVKGFALISDSPGGEVTECFELTDKIFEWRDEKPVRAFAANHAYSAAYSIASAAGPNNVIVTRSGGVGSVGVVTAHVDYSEQMKNEGVKVTFIYAGDHKVDGNPYEKLSDSVKQRIKRRIDKTYGVFTSTVARNRDMGVDEVIATQALTYDAEDAIEVGFADRIGALEEELIIYATELEDTGDDYMATQGNVTGQKPAGGETASYTQADVDSMIAAAKAEGMTAGVTAEQTRYLAITGSAEAAERPAAARMLVELGVDSATAVAKLAKMPVEAPAAAAPAAPVAPAATTTTTTGQQRATTHFEEAMGNTMNPNVGADNTPAPGGETGDKAENDANDIRASLAAYTGEKKKPRLAAV